MSTHEHLLSRLRQSLGLTNLISSYLDSKSNLIHRQKSPNESYPYTPPLHRPPPPPPFLTSPNLPPYTSRYILPTYGRLNPSTLFFLFRPPHDASQHIWTSPSLLRLKIRNLTNRSLSPSSPPSPSQSPPSAIRGLDSERRSIKSSASSSGPQGNFSLVKGPRLERAGLSNVGLWGGGRSVGGGGGVP